MRTNTQQHIVILFFALYKYSYLLTYLLTYRQSYTTDNW